MRNIFTLKNIFLLTTILSVQILNAQTGASLDFDGIDDDIELPLINFSSGNNMTIEAWIKPTNITNNIYYEVSRQENSPSPDWLVSFQNNGTILSFGLKTTSGYDELDVPIIASNFTDGNWHHVAVSYNGSMKYMYVDGVQIGSAPKTGNITFTGFTHRIGSQVGISEYFEGQIDEVRYWNIARTQCEINTFKNIVIPASATGLLGNYHFNQGIAAGNNMAIATLTDAAGIVGTGTLTGFALTGFVSNWVAPHPLFAQVAGSSTICLGSSSIYSVMAIPGATAYTWSLPPGWAGTSTSNTILAIAGSTSGNINVAASSTCATTSQVTRTVAVLACVGLDQLTNSVTELNVYPNPFDKKITIVSNEPKQTAQIFDGLGSLVYNTIIENKIIEIDLSQQISGIYFIRVGSVTKKILKQ